MDTPRNKLLNLIEKAHNLGKVLDVSAMNSNIKGYVTIDIPKNNKNPRKSVVGIAVVSTNYEAYKNAMMILGPTHSHFIDLYYNLYCSKLVPENKVILVDDIWLHIIKYLDLGFQPATESR